MIEPGTANLQVKPESYARWPSPKVRFQTGPTDVRPDAPPRLPRWQQDLARHLAVQSELTPEQQSEILRAVKEICSGAEQLTEPEPLEINETQTAIALKNHDYSRSVGSAASGLFHVTPS